MNVASASRGMALVGLQNHRHRYNISVNGQRYTNEQQTNVAIDEKPADRQANGQTGRREGHPEKQQQ